MTTITDWNYGRTTGFIKRNTLVSDIKRGVKFLSDSSYSDYSGATKISALFFQQVRKHIDLGKTYRVDFIKSRRHWFTVRIFTKDGYTIQLKGLSFGYHGEGSRGTLAVLKELGFNDKQLRKIFVNKDDNGTHFKLFKRVA